VFSAKKEQLRPYLGNSSATTLIESQLKVFLVIETYFAKNGNVQVYPT
jgi:hypothetical protein